MSRRKLDVQARVNANLAFEFSDVNLTSYAGLALFNRYVRQMRFNDLVRHAFAGAPTGSDFGVVALVCLVTRISDLAMVL